MAAVGGDAAELMVARAEMVQIAGKLKERMRERIPNRCPCHKDMDRRGCFSVPRMAYRGRRVPGLRIREPV